MRARVALGSVAVVCAIGTSGPHARAEVRRLALVDAGAQLERAVRETLAPWGISVFVIRPLAPGDSMPASAERARALAAEHAVGAVAWISKSLSGHALWVFDGESGRVVARRLSASPPFDEPNAAAVALSIKTLLRHSEVAPRGERYAAGVETPPGERRLQLEASGGIWLWDTGQWSAEPRLGIALVWWPSLLGQRFGGSVGAQTGADVAVNESDFIGHYSETSIELAIRTRLQLQRSLAIVPMVSGAVRISALDGVLVSGDEAVRADRVNPSVAAALQLELRIASLRLGLRAGASYLVERQRYLVHGQAVYEVPALGFDAAAVVGVPIY